MSLRLPDVRMTVAAACFLAAGILAALMDYPDRGPAFRYAGDQEDAVSPADYPLVELGMAASLLREHYAFQGRLQPHRMLLAALQGMAEQYDWVLIAPAVDLEEGATPSEALPDRIEVRMRGRAVTFDIGGVEDLFQMVWQISDVFATFSPPEKEARELEDAAIRGMLSVLDPHTSYLDETEYKDMKLSTEGSFGGLGIVISVRNGKLTVMSVMAGTPASRAGLVKGDVITRIDKESTVNLLVNEAVARLRGKPGTEVTLWIEREGEAEPRPVPLTREVIEVASVVATNLDGVTAYVRVKNFQQSTADEVRKYLDAAWPHHAPAGVVLDLRGNSGGVMGSAIQLADLFLPDGNVVTTVEKVRTGQDTDVSETGDRYEECALVVLVDHGSASASEIVTGALKYRNRALVMGQRTFGKGSVQYVNELQRGALKLTVAQYVGPDMEAIQGAGIEPHVELRRVGATKGVRLPSFADGFVGEGALPYHLGRTSARPVQDPSVFFLRYVEDQQEPDPDDYDAVFIDHEVLLAWSVLSYAPARTASAMLEKALPLLQELAEWEEEVIGELALTEGKEWTAGEVPADAQLELSARPDREWLSGGDEGAILVSVYNRGDRTVPRLHVRTESEASRLDRRGCLIGTLEPGAGSSCRLRFKMPVSSPARQDRVFVDLLAGNDEVLASTTTVIGCNESPRPRLAISYRLDDSRGNRDGMFQVGEAVDVLVRIRNVGRATLEKGLATAKDLSGPALYVNSGREEFADLAKGQERPFKFAFTAQSAPEDGTWRFELGVVDVTSRRHVSGTQELPVAPDGGSPAAVRRWLAPVRTPLPVLIAPHDRAPVAGLILGDGAVEAFEELGQWLRLRLPGDVQAWAPKAALSPANPGTQATFVDTWVVLEPAVRVERRVPDSFLGADARMTLVGHVDFGVGHAAEQCGVSLYVNGRKVEMAWLGDLPPDRHQVPFRFEFDLDEGVNQIVVTAFQKNQSPGYAALYYNRVIGGNADPATPVLAEEGGAR